MSRNLSDPVEKMLAEERIEDERRNPRRAPPGQMYGPDGRLYWADSAEDAHFIRIGAGHYVPGAGPL